MIKGGNAILFKNDFLAIPYIEEHSKENRRKKLQTFAKLQSFKETTNFAN